MSSPETSPENNYSAISEQLASIELHNQALIAEKWKDDVAAFREAVLAKMAPYIGQEDTGWAYFDLLEQDDLDEKPRDKDMVILLAFPTGNADQLERGIPVIRIMTNEMIAYEDTTQCLAEDFIVDHECDAWFMVDAALMSGWPKKGYAEQKTSAPIFHAQGDNDLRFLNITAQPRIQEISAPGVGSPALPFGHYSRQNDRQFVLDAAWQKLTAVWDEYPRYSSTAE